MLQYFLQTSQGQDSAFVEVCNSCDVFTILSCPVHHSKTAWVRKWAALVKGFCWNVTEQLQVVYVSKTT